MVALDAVVGVLVGVVKRVGNDLFDHGLEATTRTRGVARLLGFSGPSAAIAVWCRTEDLGGSGDEGFDVGGREVLSEVLLDADGEAGPVGFEFVPASLREDDVDAPAVVR